MPQIGRLVEGNCTVSTLRWSVVEDGTQHGNRVVREKAGPFIQLQPADNAVVGEILSDACFGYPEMSGELGLERGIAATAASAASQVPDGDAQSVASFDVVVAGQVFVGEDEHTGADGCLIGVIEEIGRASCRERV